MPKLDWRQKPSVVSFKGGETFFHQRELLKAKRFLFDYHIEEYEGGKNDQEFKTSLLTGPSPFFALKKLIIVNDANKIKKPAFLTDYCKSPSPDHILILQSSGGREAKWYKELAVTATIKCDPISDWNLAGWLVTEAKDLGYTLSKDHAEAIIMNAGTDLYTLSNELTKMSIYCGARKSIKVDDIQAALYGHSATSPFDVIRYWGEGNRPAALQFIARHFDKTPDSSRIRSELVLINGFLNQVENLLKSRSLRDAGKNDGEITSELGVSPWIFKNRISPQINIRTITELESAYAELCRIEPDMKMGKPGHLLLQSFIIRY